VAVPQDSDLAESVVRFAQLRARPATDRRSPLARRVDDTYHFRHCHDNDFLWSPCSALVGRTSFRRRDGNNNPSVDLHTLSLVIVPQAGFNCILIAQRLNRVISRLLPEYQQTIEHAATI
jgi:hypothetical protein